MAITDTLEQLSPLIDALNQFVYSLDESRFNGQLSYLTSLPQSFLHGSTPSDLSILQDTQPFSAPDAGYQAEHSPTIAQFLNASNSEFLLLDSTPDGLRPFQVGGKQVEILDQASGLSARVWQTDEHQVIIAYSGTSGGDTQYVNPLQNIGQVIADLTFFSAKPTATKSDSLAFAQYVVSEAGKQGIDVDDVFVTGHSLGANEAEYVGQQTGLGGVGFEGFGLPESDSAIGDGSNFISTVNYGDIVGSLSSDVEGEQPAAPDFDPQNGSYPHYGNLIMLGDPAAQVELHDNIRGIVGPFSGNPYLSAIAEVLALGLNSGAISQYHNPSRVAEPLAVDLKHIQASEWLTVISSALTGAEPPPVFDVADHSIAETLSADHSRTYYHSPALPPV